MRIRLITGFIAAVIVSGLFYACDDNDLGKLREKELELLDQFIQKNNITVKPTKTGLYYIEKVAGTGDSIKVGDQVDVLYRTWLIDSTLVDFNISEEGHYYDPLRFSVVPVGAQAGVIDGLNEAVQMMKLGTVAHLIVPSEIAYGQNGSGYIPAFSTMLFEVRIHKVYRASDSN
jgi:FKBP-type peptidyl-prolyl cis-trans isomerase